MLLSNIDLNMTVAQECAALTGQSLLVLREWTVRRSELGGRPSQAVSEAVEHSTWLETLGQRALPARASLI